MKKCIFCGTFDPPTVGHMSVIGKCAMMFDEVVVAIGINPKKQPYFSVFDRIFMLNEMVKGYKNVTVKHYQGMLKDFVFSEGATAVVRGARNEADIKSDEKEFNLAFGNDHDVELIFFPSPKRFEFVTSTFVKQLLGDKKSIKGYVPPEILEFINKKFSK